MTIGQRIKEARKSFGLTQRELAEKSGTATGTIQQYELGKRQPRLEQLQRISNALNVPLSQLVGTSDTIQEAVFEKLQKANDHLKASKEAEHPFTKMQEKMEAVKELCEAQNLAAQSNAVEEQEREKRKKELIVTYDKLNSICQEKVLGYAEGLAKDEENIVQYITIPSPFPDAPEGAEKPENEDS